MLRVTMADAATARRTLPRPDEAATRRMIADARSVVVKVGTNALTTAGDRLDGDRVRSLAGEIAALRSDRRRIVLVSSGAVGAGMDVLNLPQRPTDLPRLQASAAAGQARLISLYEAALRDHGTHAAQILLTGNDFKQRPRYLNVRNTIDALFTLGVVPIVNENDTVSVAEIRFGDNDRLATLVAGLLDDVSLVVLTAVEGLLDGPPGAADSRRVSYVPNATSVGGVVAEERSSLGSGGMGAKLRAVSAACDAGVPTAIIDGRRPGSLADLFAGLDVGTAFAPERATMPAWKRWIAQAAGEGGTLTLDEGATRAVREGGRSLLPVGVRRVSGTFERGDVVRLETIGGELIGRGLTNYDSDHAARLAGTKSDAVDGPDRPYLEIVHRNNLVLRGGESC